MTNTNTHRSIRNYLISYRIGTQGWSRLARPGQLDEVLQQLFREEPRAELVSIDCQHRI